MPVVKGRLNKSASCSEMSFLTIFKTLLGILYGQIDLEISRGKIIISISSLSERKNESGFSFLR